MEITQKLTAKVLDEQNIDYYYPHPRVSLNPYQDKLKETIFCFEEEIYLLLEEYEFVEVHGFYSHSLLLVKNIEGVSVHGYRTFLTTHESNILQNEVYPIKMCLNRTRLLILSCLSIMELKLLVKRLILF